ncbi:MAG: hydroxymethylbilane synthase [Vulcanibacillus sp.]
MRKIIVGSRKSELALTQTHWVIKQLQLLNLAYEFEVKEIMTTGDKILDVTLSKVGGKGLFVKEIEQALIDGEIDFAVHSLKDMPYEMPEGLTLAAIPKREDPRDCIVSLKGYNIDTLPSGAIVGTSSLRRMAQILSYRNDLQIKSIRGNLNTRLRKLLEGDYDAILLATAGIKRLGWEDKITGYIDTSICIPAVGQGALGIQARINDKEISDLLDKIDDISTRTLISAERALLYRLEGGCQIPIGAYAEWVDDQISLVGIVGSIDGKILIKQQGVAAKENAVELGIKVANDLIINGADKILAEVRGEL